METNERIFLLIDIMLKRCENDTEKFTIELTKSNINNCDDVMESYNMDIIYFDGANNIFADSKSLLISFNFGEGDILPYISLNYSDDYRNIIKVHSPEIRNKYKERVGKLYHYSKNNQFNALLFRCEQNFEITKQEIRANKIEKIIE